MALFTVGFSLSILSVLMGMLSGWCLFRQEQRGPINRRLWTWAPLAFYVMIHAGILLTDLRAACFILPHGSGRSIQIPVHFLSSQILLALYVGGICCFQILVRHKFRYFALVGGLALFAGGIMLPYARGTISHRLGDRRTDDGMILQTSGYSCAAATCANISEYYGQPATEKEMAEKLGLTDLGSSVTQVTYLLKSIGLQAKVLRSSPPSAGDLQAPTILSVYHPATGPETHLVIFMGTDQGKHEIWDPLKGKIFLSDKELYRLWEGLAIEVSR